MNNCYDWHSFEKKTREQELENMGECKSCRNRETCTCVDEEPDQYGEEPRDININNLNIL